MMFTEPHFRFEDLTANDFKENIYEDPYFRLRRPIEPERLKQIYQQAFIYDLLYGFARENFEPPSKIQDNNKATDTKSDNIRQKILDYLFKAELEADQQSKKVSIKENSELLVKVEDNLWDTNDLNTLRKSFSRIKEENFGLKTRLAIGEEELKKLREKHQLLVNETQTLPDQVRSLEKVNQRLYVRIQELEKSYKQNLDEAAYLDALRKEMRNELIASRKKVQELLNENSRNDYIAKKFDQQVSAIRNEAKADSREAVEKQRLANAKQISAMFRKNDELVKELQKEKAEHEKTRRALEHLRLHFMNSVVDTSGVVGVRKLSLNVNKDKIDDVKIKV